VQKKTDAAIQAKKAELKEARKAATLVQKEVKRLERAKQSGGQRSGDSDTRDHPVSSGDEPDESRGS
jgi:hypothetical protein